MQGESGAAFLDSKLQEIYAKHCQFQTKVLELFTKQVSAVDSRLRLLEELLDVPGASARVDFSFCKQDGLELLQRMDVVVERTLECVSAFNAQKEKLQEINAALLSLSKKSSSLNQLQPEQ